MRRIAVLMTGIAAMLLVTSTQAFAVANINAYQSADYLKSLARYASTDPDAAYFNPAGIPFMDHEGFAWSFTNVSIFSDKEVEDRTLVSKIISGGKTMSYEGECRAPIYPTFQGVWKKGNGGIFFSTGVLAAGGSYEFNNGLPMFDKLAIGAAQQAGINPATITSYERDAYSEGGGAFLHATAGYALAVTDSISVAAGLRGIKGYSEKKGHLKNIKISGNPFPLEASFNVKQEGECLGGVLGANWKVTDTLRLATQAQLFSPLELETDVKSMTDPTGTLPALYTDGATVKWEIPNIYSVAAAWAPFENLELQCAYNFYTTGDIDRGNGKSYDDGWEIIFGGNYQLTPKWNVGAGILFERENYDPQASRTEDDFELNSTVISAGVTCTVIPSLDLTFSGFKVLMDDRDGTSMLGTYGDQTYGQETFMLAMGLTWTPGK